MKKIFTLMAAGAMVAGVQNAQAQFTVDGRLNTAEVGTGIGKYQLAAQYTGVHSDADRGISAMYVGYTATTMNIMLVASPEAVVNTSYKALVMYINTPGRTGTAAGTRLAGSGDGFSPLKHRPTMDMEVDYGIRVSVGPAANDVYFSRANYTLTTPNDVYLGQGSKTGGVVTAAATTDLNGSRMAFTSTASLAANTTTGWEVEIPLSILGSATTPLAVGNRVDLFAGYTDGDGVFTTDVIPMIAGRTTALGTDPNFTTIPSTQALAYIVGSGVLGNRKADAAAVALNVLPNPANDFETTVSYQVTDKSQPVSIELVDLMGRKVSTMFKGQQAVGAQRQTLKLGSVAAGTYLVKVQVGEKVATSKVTVL